MSIEGREIDFRSHCPDAGQAFFEASTMQHVLATHGPSHEQLSGLGFPDHGKLMQAFQTISDKGAVVEAVGALPSDVGSIAESKLNTAQQRAQFKKDMEEFEKRVLNGDIPPLQARDTYKEVVRLLTESSQVGVTPTEMKTLACQVMHQAAHPEEVDQGQYNNCNVAAPEVYLYHKSPSITAKLVAETAITGKYTCADGTTIDITKSVRPNGSDGLQSPLPDNVRSYASQLFHVTAINLLQAGRNATNRTSLEYVENATTQAGNGARLLDNSKVPAAQVFGMRNGKPILETEEVKDTCGQTALDGNLQPIKSKPLEKPNLTLQDSINLLEKLTGRSQARAATGHVDAVGMASSDILDHVGLSWRVAKDARIPFFKDEAQLKEILMDARRHGKYTVLVEVHTGGGFLREQFDAALIALNKPPLGSKSGDFGGGHVVCLTDFNPVTGTVQVDGTWGRSRDKDVVTLADVVRMSKQDTDLAGQAKHFAEDKRAAYEDWCSEFKKTPGKDYPPPTMGKLRFEDYRKRHGR